MLVFMEKIYLHTLSVLSKVLEYLPECAQTCSEAAAKSGCNGMVLSVRERLVSSDPVLTSPSRVRVVPDFPDPPRASYFSLLCVHLQS